MLVKIRKLASLRNLTYFIGIGLLFVVLYFINLMNHTRPLSNITLDAATGSKHHRLCNNVPRGIFVKPPNDIKWTVNSRTRQHALVFLLDGITQAGKRILYVLQAARFKYHTQYGSVRNLPALIDNNKGRYATIIFEDADTYLELNQWNREILDKYCLEYDVGVIMFVPSVRKKTSRILYNQQMGDFHLAYSTNLEMKDYEVNPESAILRITRAEEVLKQKLDDTWTIFTTNDSNYEAVSRATLLDPTGMQLENILESSEETIGMERFGFRKMWNNGLFGTAKNSANDIENRDMADNKFTTVVHDRGGFDGIQRVIFGSDIHFWMHKILFLDAMSFLSHRKLSLPLERYIQVDIDDIFVSAVGTRMKQEDVEEMVSFQKNMRNRIPGFHFLLGFSGKFTYRGTEEEKAGDEAFLKLKDNFLWFPHMWSHMQAHWFDNKTKLCEYMLPNKKFAMRHRFNVSSGYAVAPHHSGIFPVHQQLYDCWKEVWDIQTTSTEEYPNLRPDHKRRGFIYEGIKVLPRQTCGLFTHTNIREKYPGGPEKLEHMIHGGPLFQTFLLNQYNIYMTHFSNYGSDRLALYVFDRAVNFVQCWTNLRLVQIPPSELAVRYFNDYPDEVDPIWTNPCSDPRHLEIWSKSKTCDRLPNFVIVGPQKTGTTALQWYLLMHPDLVTSKQSPKTFEEVQFFNTDNYFKGLDWYMDFFPIPDKESGTVIFEKSANYFGNEHVPQRFSALLPKANIIVLLVDPSKRAYSWYQHMRSHDDPTALKYSFYEVIKAKRKSTTPSALLSLQARCLMPGLYAEHLNRWMEYMSPRQIILEDGELLIKDPVTVLSRLQKSLSLSKIFNYTNALRFDEKKGFFCQVSDTGSTKCLGKGKGRQYPEMQEKSQLLLEEYYKDSNKRLLQILADQRQPIPNWLQYATAT